MKDNIFGKRLKDIRCGRNITQLDLAKELSVSKTTICQWETGKQEPSLDMLVRISKFFNVSIDYLVDEYFDITVYFDYEITVKNTYSYYNEDGDIKTAVETFTKVIDGGRLADLIANYLSDREFSTISFISSSRLLIELFYPMCGTGSDIDITIKQIKKENDYGN